MRAPTELVVAVSVATVLILGAALCPRAPSQPVVRQTQVIARAAPHHRTTLASMQWLLAVQDFDDARAAGSDRGERALADRLLDTVQLDPRFTHAHVAGALMLRSAAPTHLHRFVRAARSQRPDLPWRYLVQE